MDSRSIGRDVVAMNSTVILKNVRWGNVKVLRLVYPNEESGEGTLSIFTPLGAKILGARVGQTVQMKLADSPTCFRIAQIL
jgi:transcription elongation GreA/GreB family factor